MSGKKICLYGNDERWLELTIEGSEGIARVGGPERHAEPFCFSLQNLGYVTHGLGYQAWGAGGHFTFRRTSYGFAVEFQGQGDRSPAVCRLSKDELSLLMLDLSGSPVCNGTATLL